MVVEGSKLGDVLSTIEVLTKAAASMTNAGYAMPEGAEIIRKLFRRAEELVK